MKTVFLSYSVTDSSLSEYFLTLSNKLAAKYKVIVFTDRLEKHPFETDSRIEFLCWPSGRPVKPRDFVFLGGKIREYSPVLMMSMFGSINIFSIMGFMLRVPVRIAWCRSIYAISKDDKWRDLRKKYIYRLATHIFTNSRATQRYVNEFFGVANKKVTVVPSAVRARGFTAEQDGLHLVFVGRLQKFKGVDVLIDAMPRVIEQFPEAKLTIIGGNPEGTAVRQYREQARSVNVLDSVDFAARKDKDGVLEAFRRATCAIVPSTFESFGMVVIESFSVGTPVIGSDSSGIAEVIRDGIDGYHFRTGNSVDLSEKIIAMLSDKKRREAFRENCYDRLIKNYEIESATDKLFLLIDSLT